MSSNFIDFSNVAVKPLCILRFIQVSIIMSRDKDRTNGHAYALVGLTNECKWWEVAYHLYNPERIVL